MLTDDVGLSALRWDSMIQLSLIELPGWTTGDLWRWGLIAMGTLLIVRGLSSKKMRMRDSRTLEGSWRGKIVTKPRQIVYMRSLFALIGAAMIFCGLSANFP